ANAQNSGCAATARATCTLAVITVIEREGDESALGEGAGPGAGRLLLHAGQGSGQDRDAVRVALGEMKVPDQTIALAVKLIALHQIGSKCVPIAEYMGLSLLSNRYSKWAVSIW